MKKPPFTVSAKAISMIAEISALVERFSISMEQNTLKLRKTNKIKTIHSSLAIEGNKLSEEQVSDILNGKRVIAPIREIQEVKNAIDTYDNFQLYNPFSISDLLKAHFEMMKSLVSNAGKFRTKGVGVFDDKASCADGSRYLMPYTFFYGVCFAGGHFYRNHFFADEKGGFAA